MFKKVIVSNLSKKLIKNHNSVIRFLISERIIKKRERIGFRLRFWSKTRMDGKVHGLFRYMKFVFHFRLLN